MAAYRRVDDLTVTCRLTACTPGSAPGTTLGIEYGKPLPFYSYSLTYIFFRTSMVLQQSELGVLSVRVRVTTDLYSTNYDSSLKFSGMACVNKESHSFTCHPRIYLQVE